MFKLILISLTGASIFSFFGQATEQMTYDLHSNKQIYEGVIKNYPANNLNERFESKEAYNIKYNQDNYYQVDKTYIENQYGSTKETAIYYSKGNNHYLISENEFTSENIISSNKDLSIATKLEHLPFNIN